MSLFNTLNTLAKSIGDVTSDAIEGNNINSKLNKEKAEIADIMAEIGEIYYEEYKNGAQIEGVILDLMKRVDTHAENIKRLEHQRQGPKCNSCGSDNSEGDKFCRACGGSLIPEPVQMKTCPSCDASVAMESVFCGECGTKVD